jgi:cell division protein ZapA (FtsZ GTPase activity inhibitor)
MDEKLAIKLKILDRYYPLKIKWSDEEKLREAAKRINDTVAKYQSRYANNDEQDFLAMAALQYATALIEAEADTNPAEIEASLQVLLDDIESFRKSIQ